MSRSFLSSSICVVMTLVLGVFAVLSSGCGAIDANGFLELETCDIVNCDGLFFRNLADDHDDMAGMDDMDDADAHDDGVDDHMDGVDDHDDGDDDGHTDDMADHDDGDDDHMDDLESHDQAEDEEHDDATEGDGGGGSGVARS